MGNIINANVSTAPITENTTLGELLAILGPVTKADKTPTARKLREEAGEPVAEAEGCTVYAIGYCVYDNGSGRTVMWLPSCTSFTYRFDKLRDSEQGGEIREKEELPEGLLESQPWVIPVTLIGEHRIEANSMNRMGSRTGTKDYDADDNGDKDGDAEDAVEKSYRTEYVWREGRFGENPEDAYIREENLREMLDCMTEKQREVFILYYKEGYTQSEIAGRMGVSRVAVKHLLDKALKKAKKLFYVNIAMLTGARGTEKTEAQSEAPGNQQAILPSSD